MMQYSYVDEGTSTSVTDWIGTGSDGAGGEVVEFGLTTASSVASATQVDVRATLRSATINSTADTVGFALRVNGALQAVYTVTMTTTWTNYATTFTGNWTQAEVDSMQIYLIRNVVGSSGPASSRDDDVQIANTYATLTYTQSVQFGQSAYRWFGNEDSSTSLTFVKTNGGAGQEVGFGLAKLSDGGYVTTGDTVSYGAGGTDMKVTRFSASGNVVWTRAIGGSANETANVIVATSDGGTIVAGPTASYGAGGNDILIVKLDSSGAISWSRTWGGTANDNALGMIQTSDGGYAIAGRTNSYGAGLADMALIKLDSSGAISWSRTWGGTDLDIGQSIIQTSDGGLVLAGQTASFGTNTDAFVIKYDSSGSVVWQSLWGGSGLDKALDVALTSDDGFIITGDTASYGSGSADAFMAKYDSLGNLSWSRTWGGTGNDYAYGVTQVDADGYTVVGNTNSYGSGIHDSFLLKYDSSGALTWNRLWGGAGDDIYRDVLLTTDGGYIAYGNTDSWGAGSHDGLLAKYDASGNIAGCANTMCQTPTATVSSPTVTGGAVTGTLSSPVVTLGTPSPSIATPNVTATVVVADSPAMGVSTPLAAVNTAATSPAAGTPFRLRMNIHAGNASVDVGSVRFKLQVAKRGTDNVCDTSFTNETYNDVSPSSGDIRFYDNINAMDDQAIAANANDPTHGTDTLVRQSYEENNNFAVTNAIASEQDGMWDFALTVDPGAPTGTSYCFRAVRSTGTSLDTYTYIAEIQTLPTNLTQANYRWFGNVDSTTPGPPLAAQDTATTIAAQTPFRLRSRLAVDTANLAASGQSFKLQYAERSGVCDGGFAGESYQDFAMKTPTTYASATAAVNDTTLGTVAWTGIGSVYASDDTRASVTLNTEESNYIKATGFGFSVPSSATITGVQARIESRQAGFGQAYLNASRIVKGGVISGNSIGVSNMLDTTDTTIEIGGESANGGVSLTPSDVNSSNFGIATKAVVDTDSATVDIDHIELRVYYEVPQDIIFHDNATISDGASVPSDVNDPTNASRSKVMQSYQEGNPFTNNVAVISAGSDGLWDFALNSSAVADGKTYCFRIVKSDGNLLDTYSQIPEITIGSGGGPVTPALNQQLRGGQSVIDGIKRAFMW